MTTLPPDLRQLIGDTERQLDEAIAQAASGALVDLGDLVPRLERISALAVAERATEAAPLLAALIGQLDLLGAALKQRIDADTAARQADPGQAAARYRAAQPPSSGGN
jgi:hypothetical protein